MQALIVESNPCLAEPWALYLEALGVNVTVAATGDAACLYINPRRFDVIVLDLVLRAGSALAIADLADFRQPDANVVFVTNTAFFSDGSIFRHASNARAFVDAQTPAKDLAAIVHHYGVTPHARAAHQECLAG
jgi:CheY-like chemotaxis protein